MLAAMSTVEEEVDTDTVSIDSSLSLSSDSTLESWGSESLDEQQVDDKTVVEPTDLKYVPDVIFYTDESTLNIQADNLVDLYYKTSVYIEYYNQQVKDLVPLD